MYKTEKENTPSQFSLIKVNDYQIPPYVYRISLRTYVYIHELFLISKSEINYSYYITFCFFPSYIGSLCLNCLACGMDKEAVPLLGLL